MRNFERDQRQQDKVRKQRRGQILRALEREEQEQLKRTRGKQQYAVKMPLDQEEVGTAHENLIHAEIENVIANKKKEMRQDPDARETPGHLRL